MEEEMITITKRQYDALLDESAFLDCLRACGVDNWEGYSDACEMMSEGTEE